MSEYQYIEFRAIDGPVSDKNLEYMQKQSSRAEITPWSFTNEYHYSDFRGNVLEMLRRGYDMHLHYANFGIRTLMVRLPSGLPNEQAAAPYLDSENLTLHRDKTGRGCILEISPSYEPGTLEDLWDLDVWLPRMLDIRSELIEGDLRPLFIARLGADYDSYHDPAETKEAPLPAGMGKLSAAQLTLAKFYGLDRATLAAAAQGAPPLPANSGLKVSPQQWLQGQSPARKDAWLAGLLSEDHAAVRPELVQAYRDDQPATAWPVVETGRTLEQLGAAAAETRQDMKAKAAAKREQERQQRLAKIAKDPDATLKQVDELVSTFSTSGYEEASKLLAELLEARPADGAKLAEAKAQMLRKKYPTKYRLVAALRAQDLLEPAPKLLAKAAKGKQAR